MSGTTYKTKFENLEAKYELALGEIEALKEKVWDVEIKGSDRVIENAHLKERLRLVQIAARGE